MIPATCKAYDQQIGMLEIRWQDGYETVPMADFSSRTYPIKMPAEFLEQAAEFMKDKDYLTHMQYSEMSMKPLHTLRIYAY